MAGNDGDTETMLSDDLIFRGARVALLLFEKKRTEPSFSVEPLDAFRDSALAWLDEARKRLHGSVTSS